jgi:hypothetical protein
MTTRLLSLILAALCLGVRASEPGERLGDAWSDPRNPIVQIFGGKRLDLWSLKPVVRPEVPVSPVTEHASRITNPIDAFIRVKLAAHDLRPSPEADRRTLARRLYFNLTGLPPTPEELAAFLADDSTDAYERLVDRLLASPRYGEHWARQWLDVIRYSDSNGFDWDEYRKEAWRFRDYVIRSFNADKPFDQFIREQLAGDELLAGPPTNEHERDQLIATGYLRVGPQDNSASLFNEQDRARRGAGRPHRNDRQRISRTNPLLQPLPRPQIRSALARGLFPDARVFRAGEICRRSATQSRAGTGADQGSQ